MLETILLIFVGLIVIGVIYWGGHRIAAGFGIGEPIMTIFDVFLVVVALFWLLRVMYPLVRSAL